MQKMPADLFVCAGSVFDTHLKMWQVLAEKLYGNQRSEDAILIQVLKKAELKLDIQLICFLYPSC